MTNITDGAGGSKENKSCCNVKATVGKVFILFQYFNEGIESSLILSGPLSNANNSTTESRILISPLSQSEIMAAVKSRVFVFSVIF